MKIQITAVPENTAAAYEFTAPYGTEELCAYTKYSLLYMSPLRNGVAAALIPLAAVAAATKFYLVAILLAIAFAALIMPLFTIKSSAKRSEARCDITYRFYDGFFTAERSSGRLSCRVPCEKIRVVVKYGFIMLLLPDKSGFVFAYTDERAEAVRKHITQKGMVIR